MTRLGCITPGHPPYPPLPHHVFDRCADRPDARNLLLGAKPHVHPNRPAHCLAVRIGSTRLVGEIEAQVTKILVEGAPRSGDGDIAAFRHDLD